MQFIRTFSYDAFYHSSINDCFYEFDYICVHNMIEEKAKKIRE